MVPTVSDVELADVIVSLASAAADANAILDSDPNSSFGITRFEIETNITAVVRVPTANDRPPPKYKNLGRGSFGISSFPRSSGSGLAFSELLQPTLREALLPSTKESSAQITVKAVIEPMPNIP